MSVASVRVPEEIEAPFAEAERRVRSTFETLALDASQGTIHVGGERYILVRAASLSVHFVDFVRSLYPGLDEDEATDAAARVLYDIGHAIGRADARHFHAAHGVTDPIARLSAGPVHFAFAGWAYVDISPESRPTPDEGFYLLYDHPRSFEADSWAASGRTQRIPLCRMNAGYSAGWCEVSFGLDLAAREVLCRARGDSCCRFVLAHPTRVGEREAEYRRAHPELFGRG